MTETKQDWPVAEIGLGKTVAGLAGLGRSVETDPVGSFEKVLDEVRAHLEKYISPMQPSDLDLLTLWFAHTHLCEETYTSPRLLIDSPMPGSGKTTVLEHAFKLCAHPIRSDSLTSSALLARLLVNGIRTILIDEADRNLDPKRPGVEELTAVLNSGYKRGGTRPVLTGNQWDGLDEMSTFAPVAMAGNAPHLPEDTKSRCIRVLLLPDLEGRVESSDWEEIEEQVEDLGRRLANEANLVREKVRTERPPIADNVKARNKERWYPLKRVAAQAGPRWSAIVDELIQDDLLSQQLDREDGLSVVPIPVQLLRDLSEVWADGETFISTTELVSRLIRSNPKTWSSNSTFGRDLTAQRMGSMMARAFKVNTKRSYGADGVTRTRGYSVDQLLATWDRMGIRRSTDRPKPARPATGVKSA